MKCLSLSNDDHEDMRAGTATWYCSSCIIQIFPLNTIEEEYVLICELNGIDIDEYTIDSLSSRLFNPFQLNDKDYCTPLSQIDPDVHFFNNVHRPKKVYERFCLPRIRPLRCDFFNKSLSENPCM